MASVLTRSDPLKTAIALGVPLLYPLPFFRIRADLGGGGVLDAEPGVGPRRQLRPRFPSHHKGLTEHEQIHELQPAGADNPTYYNH